MTITLIENGETYTFPDDTTEEEINEIVGYSAPAPVKSQYSDVSNEDLYKGSTVGRLIGGVADLPLGAYQLGANAGDMAYGGIVDVLKGVGAIDEDFQRSSHSDDVNQWMKDREASKQRGMKAYGNEGFDAYGLVGNILSGGAAMKGVNMGAKLGEKVIRGAGVGAGLGAATPVVDGDFGTQKAIQTGGGAVLGGGVAGGAHGVGKLVSMAYNRFAPMFESATDTAGRAIRETIGPEKLQAVTNALKADVNPLTKGSAAEAAAGAKSTKFSALQDAADDILPDEKMARILAQRAGRKQVIDDIEAVGQPAKDFRETVTAPMRQNALNRANENTQKQMALSQQLQKLDGSDGYTPKPGATNIRTVPNAVRNRYGIEGEEQLAHARSAGERTPGVAGMKMPKVHADAKHKTDSYAPHIADAKSSEALVKAEREMVDYQLQAMKGHGIQPSTPNLIVKGIQDRMHTPKVEGNEVLEKLLVKIQARIGKMTKEDGTIDPASLYEFRKKGLDLAIAKHLGPNADKSIVSELGGNVKPLLDDVIESASGGGWKRYLKAYSRLSRPVEQGQIGKHLQDKFIPALSDDAAQKPAALANALRGGEKEVNKATGSFKQYDEILNPKQMKKVDALKSDLERAESVKEMASVGRKAVSGALKGEDKTLPNPLMREIMVLNSVIRGLSKGHQKEVEQEVARLMQRDPQAGFRVLAEALERGAPENRHALIKIMSKYPQLERLLPAASGVAAGQSGGNLGV